MSIVVSVLSGVSGWVSIDLIAAIVGIFSAIIAYRSTPIVGNFEAVAAGFAAGSSGFLIAVTAVLVFDPDPQHTALVSLLTKNGVLSFGALGYAALVNFRTCPGMLEIFTRKKPAKDDVA